MTQSHKSTKDRTLKSHKSTKDRTLQARREQRWANLMFKHSFPTGAGEGAGLCRSVPAAIYLRETYSDRNAGEGAVRERRAAERASALHQKDTALENSLYVPPLEHDRVMLERFGRGVSPGGRLERLIVAALAAHVAKAGWLPYRVDDGGDGLTAVRDIKAAMELIFSMDEAHLYFHRSGHVHSVLLVLGNGVDIVSDYNYSEGDGDGWLKLMHAFDPEVYA